MIGFRFFPTDTISPRYIENNKVLKYGRIGFMQLQALQSSFMLLELSRWFNLAVYSPDSATVSIRILAQVFLLNVRFYSLMPWKLFSGIYKSIFSNGKKCYLKIEWFDFLMDSF